jgi:hypothetical protein
MNDPQIKSLHYCKPIVELGPMISATFHHEAVGRYTTEIRTTKGLKKSAELYRKHKRELRKLIDLLINTLA